MPYLLKHTSRAVVGLRSTTGAAALVIVVSLVTAGQAPASGSTAGAGSALRAQATTPPVPVPLRPDTAPPAIGTTGHAENGCGTDPYGWIKAASAIRLRVRLTVPGGSRVRAAFNVRDLSAAGRVVARPLSAPRSASGPAVGKIRPTLTNGHLYRWDARELTTTQKSASSTGCRFGIDTSAPPQPAVASTAFPPAGSTPTGVPGPFTFSAVDPVPTGCKPGQCTASGVARFEYSLDSPIPARGIKGTTATQGIVQASNVPPGNVASGTLSSLTVTNWGVHTLYVQAVDHAGNRSSPASYGFFVPMNLAGNIPPPVPGDINGDNVPDLIATTSGGGLNLYPGSTTSQSFPAPVDATANDASPDGGNDWDTFQITHRSSLVQGPLDDLLAHKGIALYVYINNPSHPGVAPQFGNTGQLVLSNRPACAPTADNKNNCTGYVSTWADVSQMLAVGDPYPRTELDPPTSLVTVENGALWFFPGAAAQFGNPVLLGSSGWDGMTLIAPGYLNGQITIWARDNATGTIYSYPITIDANGLPTLDPAKPGTPVTATSGPPIPGISLPAATYPVLASPGDPVAPASLYAVDSSGNVWLFAGTFDAAAPLPASGTQIGSVTPGSIKQLS